MTARLRALLPTLAVVLVAAGAAAASLEEAQRRAALGRPVIDGLALAGIRLGRDELTVRSLFGAPAAVQASALGDRRLAWTPLPGVHLEVHVRAGRVVAAGLRVVGPEVALASPRTVRGIGLADPVTLVRERYGAPDGGRLWFTEAGIAFNEAVDGDEVQAILVFVPGTPPP